MQSWDLGAALSGTERKNRSQNSHQRLADNWKGQSETNWGCENRRMIGATEEAALAVRQRCGLWICQPGAGQRQVAGAGAGGGQGGRWLEGFIKSGWLLVPGGSELRQVKALVLSKAEEDLNSADGFPFWRSTLLVKVSRQ